MTKYRDGEERTDLIKRLVDMEKRIKNLETGNSLGYSSVDVGSLTINAVGGTFKVKAQGAEVLSIGPIGGNGLPGLVIRKADGTEVFSVIGAIPEKQTWQFLDSLGNIVIGDDFVSGVGLARPYIQGYPVPSTYFSTPPYSTASASFTPLETFVMVYQNPMLRAIVLVSADPGTSGEIRLHQASSDAVLVQQSISAGTFGYFFLDGEVPQRHQLYELLTIDVDVRRTGGAGIIRAGTVCLHGKQS